MRAEETADRDRGGRPAVTTAHELAAVAQELFLRQGFDETSIDDIARSAGIGRRTFFRYFRSKADVLFTNSAAELNTLGRELSSAPAAEDYRAVVVGAVVAALRVAPEDREWALQRAQLILSVPPLQAHAAVVFARWRGAASGYIADRFPGEKLSPRRRACRPRCHASSARAPDRPPRRRCGADPARCARPAVAGPDLLGAVGRHAVAGHGLVRGGRVRQQYGGSGSYAPLMQLSAALEQHIAVFGESGSGKTVLLSSFYGATQEPQYRQNSLFDVVADDVGQGTRLHRNYLGMKNSARVPEFNRFSATAYSFSVKLRPGSDVKAPKGRPFDALRLVWHDYPGEWFEQDVSGPEEADRRVEAFRSLLSSDVALLLVDGQRLVDNSGEEERYLKSLLANFRNGLTSLRDDLLEDGKPLVDFPRIWVLALSKSDLLPDLDVFGFRDLLVEKAGDDIDDLRAVIAGLVEGNEALSVGEDFLLLSSARFEAGQIQVSQRVGVELILSLAAMLPFQRHVRWAQLKYLPGKVVESLLRGLGPLADVLTQRLSKVPGRVGHWARRVRPSLDWVVDMAGEKLREANADALAKHDHLRAVLTGFGLDLDRGEAERILIRSRR